MNNIAPIFDFLKQKADAGLRTVLVTLVSVTGASTRNPGAHMAVAEDGSSVGSFSGGCIETAVVAEALDALNEGKPREVRYGAGSPYLDIRLPCGGGIELLFAPIKEPQIIIDIYDYVMQRLPVTIGISSDTGVVSAEQIEALETVTRDGELVFISHLPAAKVIILGQGASVDSLAKLSEAYGTDCAIYTPDQNVLARAKGFAAAAHLLKTPAAIDGLQLDKWTACVFYFHDHDWEAQLIKQALQSASFYVGAMGSVKTHTARKEMLENIGVTQSDIARMKAPIGLIPSTRDPETLALSTMAEIVDQYHFRFQR